MSRFDHIKYDEISQAAQESAKVVVSTLEVLIESIGHSGISNKHKQTGRSKSIAISKLEEVYMWIGKAIRDDQLSRASHKESSAI